MRSKCQASASSAYQMWGIADRTLVASVIVDEKKCRSDRPGRRRTGWPQAEVNAIAEIWARLGA